MFGAAPPIIPCQRLEKEGGGPREELAAGRHPGGLELRRHAEEALGTQHVIRRRTSVRPDLRAAHHWRRIA